jgi:hypothetical protein
MGRDIAGGASPPTFNMTFSLSGDRPRTLKSFAAGDRGLAGMVLNWDDAGPQKFLDLGGVSECRSLAGFEASLAAVHGVSRRNVPRKPLKDHRHSARSGATLGQQSFSSSCRAHNPLIAKPLINLRNL